MPGGANLPRRGRAILLLLAAGGGLLWAAARWGRSPAAQGPLPRAVWYWHHPFALAAGEAAALRGAGITRLLVHAGTLTRQGNRLRLGSRQQWQSSFPWPTDAVLRVHPEANRLLLAPGSETELLRLVREARLPDGVKGLQLDADIPTASLREYARSLEALKRSLPAGWRLGVTALPDWLRSPNYRALCDAVDEVAPQFYGNRWPEGGKPPPPLWESADLLARVERATAGRARAWIGLPAYGRCLVADARGNPLGVRHDIDPASVSVEPSWELKKVETRRARWHGTGETAVEDQVGFQAREGTTAGLLDVPAGTWLWFQWPRRDGLREFTRALQARRPPGVAGVCFFRWPEPGEPLAYPLTGLLDERAEILPRLRLTGSRDRVKIEVESGDGALPGLEAGLRLELFPAGGEWITDEPPAWFRDGRPASAARGDTAVLTRPFQKPGGIWNAGEVRGAGGELRVRLTWQDAAGRSQQVEAKR